MKTHRKLLLLPRIFFILILFMSCEDVWNHCVDGNGTRMNETRQLESFDQIQVSGDFDVQIDTGRESSVVVETDENLLDLVVTHVSGNKLIIETRDDHCLNPSRPIEITINTPSASEIILEGSGEIRLNGASVSSDLKITGSGNIRADQVETDVCVAYISGSGQINTLVNNALDVTIIGSGLVYYKGNPTVDSYVSGSGKVIHQ